MRLRASHVIVAGAIALTASATVVLSGQSLVPGQITPDPPTTPQPTVPCTPLDGCGRGPGIQRDVAFAWIDRYCNGEAVATPPGMTTFALNYGLGGQSTSPVQFFGVLEANGVEIPSTPLDILNPGEKDTRIRTAVVPDGTIFTVTITGVSTETGASVIFGNGDTTRVRQASGTCPTFSLPDLPPLPSIPDLGRPGRPGIIIPEVL